MELFKRLYDWIDVRIGAREIVEKELTGYLLPRNINVWYSLGSVLLFIFALQVVTGILLLIYYVPDADKAFKSVTSIMNDVPYGWLIRMCHAVGSNMMVLVLLLHMLSVLFMGSYKSPRELNWLTGFILFTLVQGISLTGYLLPWSQLSFWATTVATNSARRHPGGRTAIWWSSCAAASWSARPPWGVSLPCTWRSSRPAIAALVGAHLFLLKRTGVSTPPFGLSDTTNQWQGDSYRYEDHPGGIPFFPNYVLQDLRSISIYLACLPGGGLLRSLPLLPQGRLHRRPIPSGDAGPHQAGVVFPGQLPDPEDLPQRIDRPVGAGGRHDLPGPASLHRPRAGATPPEAAAVPGLRHRRDLCSGSDSRSGGTTHEIPERLP